MRVTSRPREYTVDVGAGGRAEGSSDRSEQLSSHSYLRAPNRPLRCQGRSTAAVTEKTLNIGLGKPVATSTLRPKTGLSQRQRGVQAYRAGVGQRCLPVGSPVV